MSDSDNTFKWFLERKSGLLYTTYAVTFVLSNWKFFYVLLVSSQFSGAERIREAQTEFLSRSLLGLNWGEYWLLQFLIPAVATFLIIRYVPLMNHWAYSQFLKHEKNRFLTKHKRDATLASEIAQSKEQELESYQTTEELQAQINTLLAQISSLQAELGEEPLNGLNVSSSEEQEWAREYDSYESNEKLSMHMKEFYRVLYSNGGLLYNNAGKKILSDDNYAFLDVNGLIQRDGPRKIQATKKGLFFMKRYIDKTD